MAPPVLIGRLTAKFDYFFNQTKVETAAENWARRVLYSTGGYGRKVVKSTIQRPTRAKRQTVSEPGKPPIGHTGKLRKSVLFQVYMDRRSVVIGPRGIGTSSSPVPALLEFGGTVTRRGTGYRRTRSNRKRRWRYRPRPYVFKNFDKTKSAMQRFMQEDQIR